MATRAFAWNDDKRRAAVLVAADEFSDAEIAAEIGVNRVTLEKWKRREEFRAQVGDHAGEIARGMLRLTIAKKHKRLAVLDDLHRKLLTVIDERADENASAAHDDDADAAARKAARSLFGREDAAPAGGGTGLILKQYKQIGAGRNAQLIVEYAVDTRTIGEIRAIHEQAAKELGQWVERSEVGGTVQVVRVIGADVGAI